MASRTRLRIFSTLFALLSLIHISLAASATSFCKCTCFGNSTIIQLDGTPPTTPKSSLLLTTREAAKAGRGTCNDCNRAFCKNYNLPICKAAKEEDIVTTCFQRDSAKDEAVVFIFIFATVGLLIYAAVRPWVEKWALAMRERRSYIPISTAGAEEES
ncbi:hypothetical protein E2P81_ATG04290 [Venturia nashicola]|nr:hypothetical protein E2P81_ATG04290 [Venturia nashicola]